MTKLSMEQKRDRAYANAKSMRAFARTDVAQAAHWNNKAAELEVIGDQWEERILEVKYAKTVPAAVRTAQIIDLSNYRKAS